MTAAPKLLFDGVGDYYGRLGFDLDEVVRRAERRLAGRDVDTLVAVGLSGALVVPHLAHHLGLHFAVARKEGEVSHNHDDGRPLRGRVGRRWAFVDDFVQSGRTRDRARAVVDAATRGRAVFVGCFLYKDDAWRPS